jgi:MFS family permease
VKSTERFVTALRSGVGFLLSHAQLRWVTLGAAIVNLVFAPLEALLPLFIADYLGSGITGPHFLAFLFTEEAQIGLFIGLQAAVGSVLIVLGPRIASRVHLGRMFTVGLFLFGAGFITMAFSNSFWGFVPAGIGIGGVGFANIAIVTMRQRLSPAEKLGRVASASRTISWSLIPIGAAVGGAIADWIGIKTVYVFGSLGVLATALFVMRTAVWSGDIAESTES